MSAQSDRTDLETIRALAGSLSGPEQDLGMIIAQECGDHLSDIDSETRARVLLVVGKVIAQVSGANNSREGVVWGNAVLTAAVNQEES